MDVLILNRKTWFAMRAPGSGELYSYRNRVLVHDNRRELEYLFPNVGIVELPRGRGLGRPVMLLRRHPDMHAVRFPLRQEDFEGE